MKTPIVDFVNKYNLNDTIRMHMPGHKGRKHLGAEAYDITEVNGADVLYHAEGIIAESEANAAAIFGTAMSLYSTEGSSLCIRAMLMLVTMLARSCGRQRAVIAAGRNAHKTFITAAGLMDIDVRWMYANVTKEDESVEESAEATADSWNGIVTCRLSAMDIEQHILNNKPDAVYITSPDYLGNMADIKGIADVCHSHNCLLLVDNAHGAYLALSEVNSSADIVDKGADNPKWQFNKAKSEEIEPFFAGGIAASCRERETSLSKYVVSMTGTQHPIALGADICCDSAHKTLPVLTGGAYLHIAHRAPSMCFDAAEQALSMFATTSPSYLILQSLDLANKLMTESMPHKLAALTERVAELKQQLIAAGWELIGDESIKLTLLAKSYGYTGDELADILREHNIEPEFSDPDYLVLMLSTDTSDADMTSLAETLLHLSRRPTIQDKAPTVEPGTRVMSIRDALFSLSETVPVSEAKGRILAEPGVTCPPAVPIAVCGEIIDDNAIDCFKYYGIDKIKVVKAEDCKSAKA